jgi:hypothetical protein
MKYIISVLTILFVSCSNTSDPDVTAIKYNSVSGTVDSTNKASKSQMLARIQVLEGGFTGNPVSFDITPATESTFYQLTFNPVLSKGKAYYVVLQTGAFNNKGTSILNVSLSDGDSRSGAYEFTP